MRSSNLVSLAVCASLVCLGAAPAQAPAGGKEPKIFPFDYTLDDLDNGLRLITVPLPYPDLVSFYVVVRAGSRNEVEPGKSGFAHFFEHMMFRGTEKYPPEKYNDIMKEMGADHNAFTTDDFTAYHMLIGKEDLEKAMELESDRFQNLKYPEDAFRTEAKAVLGEYNKNSANPVQKLFETMRDASFTEHTYKHTTMGFLKDIEDMPNQFEYSRTFFDRFYRPENVVLVVAGDVTRAQVLPLVKQRWGAWKRGGFSQAIPAEPEPVGPHVTHVDWPTPTLPWVVVGFRGPAFSTERPDMAALDLAAEIAFSESSPLYRKLVIDEQKADTLFTYFQNQRDPGLVFVGARVKDPADMVSVRDGILATIETLRTHPVSVDRLKAIKSNLKYGFALGMDNTAAVAAALAGFVELDPTPETINRLYATYDRLTPDDVKKACETWLTEKRRTIATLTPPGVAAPPPPGAVAAGPASMVMGDGGAPAARPAPAPPAPPEGKAVGPAALTRPAKSPLVSFRVLLRRGAASDPNGKEGVAALTAALLSGGGTREMTYQEIVQALYPMAASVNAQVDKEMTVFTGTTHVDNLKAYDGILTSMLLDPGWREEDFRRVRDDAINDLKINLRGNNDEELGKEALYLALFPPSHPYGHHNTGTIASLEKLTLDDVKAFYKAHYTQANLTLGIAGGYPETFPDEARRVFARLPAGGAKGPSIPEPKPVKGQSLEIIRKDTRATAISLGFPITVTRSHPDWPALWVATSWLGQHRSSNSHLYQRLREVRGLNYGDYAYMEHFPRGMFQFHPDPNLVRVRQIFQVWIRPVEPVNAHFALRASLFELKKLIDQGLSEEEFQATRGFLRKYAAVMARTQSARLGYALDSEVYGIGEFVPWVRGKLDALTAADVNRAIRSHLSWQNVQIVVVAKDAEDLRAAIVGNRPSPISYNAPKPADVVEEDKVIEAFPLSVAADRAVVVDIEDVFRK